MSTRPPERADLDALLDVLLPHAQQLLQKRGAFLPFGAVMNTGGEINMVAGYAGERPHATDAIDVMRQGLRSQAAAGDIRAAGICYDVTVRRPNGQLSDAVAVALEHEAGDAVEVTMPYSKPRFGGPRFEELSAAPGERHIFRGVSSPN